MTDGYNDDKFTGFKFLMDVKSSRQYAIEFVEGKPKRPLHIFGSPLAAGETAFALDDNQLKTAVPGGALIEAEAYQIKALPPGGEKDYEFLTSPVTYRVSPAGFGKGFSAELTPESKNDLLNAGFDPSFPTTFNNIDRPAPGGKIAILVPPQHENGRAEVARAAIFGSKPPRPKQDFPTPPPKKYKFTDAQVEAALAKYCVDLTEEGKNRRLDPVIGRDEEIDQAMKILIRRKQGGVCFTGEAGVGKSAMFSGVAQCIANGQKPNGDALPESLQGARVMLLDLQSANAGSKYRGDFEEKVKPIFEGIQERNGEINGKKIIFAIDELHSQLTAGAAEGGSNAGQMMKPMLATVGVSIMATTTDAEYKKHIEKDAALSSRFEKKRLDPPNEAATEAILKKLWPLTKAHNGLTKDLTDEDLAYIVTMTNRYAPQESQPRKAEKVMNMAAASAEYEHRTAINRADVIAAVSQMSGLSIDFLSQNDSERFLKMEQELPKDVLGQPGLKRLTDGLIGSRSGLNDPKQPWGCFVMQGPTGTGKTEACKSLARFLFGSEEALIKLDMSEYSEKHTVSRLIGAPPGYVGFEDAEPALTERIRQRPYSILLLDEIEKAHKDVFNVLLPILNDGKMTDSHGKTVLFNNVIVVMTTNAGAEGALKIVEGKSGMSFGSAELSQEKVKADLDRIYENAVKVVFKPEMINRIKELGGFITFLPLPKEVITQLATREINNVAARIGATDGANLPGVKLEVSQNVMDQIAKEGYVPSMGARPLRGVVREKVRNPLGKWIMAHKTEIEAFIKKEGSAKIVIDSIDNFAPKLAKAAAPVNDNAPKAAPAKKNRTARQP